MVIEITGLFSGMDKCDYPGALMEPFRQSRHDEEQQVQQSHMLPGTERKEKTQRVFHSVVATLQSVQLKH